MTKFFERNSTKITISEFYDNYLSNKYNFNASYQRKNEVWSEDKKSFLIDSILKNYPIPAIFMRPIVDTQGKTKYDVIDGKQRLNSIIAFIENKTPLTTYFSDDNLLNNDDIYLADEISGKLFKEIQEHNDSARYIKQFWTYALQIEYLYADDDGLISNVFDRLNRNGEPLNFQELRNAKYANTLIIKYVKKLNENVFLKNTLRKAKASRMEDEEFVSEILLLTINNRILDSDPKKLDEEYEKFKNNKIALEQGVNKTKKVIDYIKGLGIDFKKNDRLCWNTHFYTLFTVCWYCVENNIDIHEIKDKITSFYDGYFEKKINNDNIFFEQYKSSASSRTRSLSQRRKRMEAILGFCNIKQVE